MTLSPPNVTAGRASVPLAETTLMLDSAAATHRVGLALGSALAPNALVLLRGELGSGKTTLIKAMCEALGIPPATVISPTYTLVNIYPGAPTAYHVDLYRLERPEALTHLDEHDWLNPEGPTFIEWPEIAEPLLAGRPALRIALDHEGLGRRLHAMTDDPALIPAIAALKQFPPALDRPHR
jgi:tRNA threonylcarbamoyladenosine biosynthesis protein TsaE